ncbi:MAG: RIP metalloprotease RseP [Deltaproteobacteria bacterium]|nr:RIP metalloprotease RseP [Deltaproteobacteria bacterium]
MTILYFIIALGVLVLVHEWGHFIVARRVGIKVEKFSIGFGPKLFSIQGKVTEYQICLLPLGGFVKLFGEDPVAEAEGDEAKANEIASSKEAFSSKSLSKRLATVFAGPSMNLVLALVLMPVVFMLGRMLPAILEEDPVVLGVKEGSPAAQAGILKGDRILAIDGKTVKDWSAVLDWVIVHPNMQSVWTLGREGETKIVPLTTVTSPFSEHEAGYVGVEPHFFWGDDAIVGTVNPGSPAEKGGLKEKDLILSLNGELVPSWTEMSSIVRKSEGKELLTVYKRGAEILETKITPEFSEAISFYVMGITKFIDPALFVKKKYGLIEAVQKGTEETKKLFLMTGDVLGRLFTFQLSVKSLGGPLQIAQASGTAARLGLGEFLYFMAFLSMQLGVLNLLPIPVLDGGHVLFMAIEGIRRKPVSLKARTISTQVGMAFLLGLMILITFNDVDRMWGFSNLFEKIRGIF